MPERGWLLIVSAPILIGVLVLFGLWYAEDRGVPADVARVLLPAFLFEAILYVASGLRYVRERLDEARPAALACGFALSAPISYLLCSLPAGVASWNGVAVLIGLGAVASFWYLIWGRHALADAGFLLLMAVPVLLKLFDAVYPDLAPRIPTEILGVLMWYRTGLLSVLVLRRMDGIGFGFVPRAEEWAIGMRNFLWFLPIGMSAAFAIGFVRVRPVEWEPRTFLIAAATFVGVLWVLAVAEEFFFRGLLQQLLTRLFGSPTAGLLVASAIFGAAHLPYREFPNWRFALLAAVAGLFYGRAYQQAGSIRAAMVTHACVVTLWKTFLM